MKVYSYKDMFEYLTEAGDRSEAYERCAKAIAHKLEAAIALRDAVEGMRLGGDRGLVYERSAQFDTDFVGETKD